MCSISLSTNKTVIFSSLRGLTLSKKYVMAVLLFLNQQFRAFQLNITTVGGINLGSYIKSTEWSLTKAESIVHYSIWETELLYSYVYFDLTMQRKPLNYVTNMIVPCVMLSLIMMFVQFLPSTAGKH